MTNIMPYADGVFAPFRSRTRKQLAVRSPAAMICNGTPAPRGQNCMNEGLAGILEMLGWEMVTGASSSGENRMNA